MMDENIPFGWNKDFLAGCGVIAGAVIGLILGFYYHGIGGAIVFAALGALIGAGLGYLLPNIVLFAIGGAILMFIYWVIKSLWNVGAMV